MNSEEIISMIFSFIPIVIFIVIFAVFGKTIKKIAENIRNINTTKREDRIQAMMAEAPDTVKKIFRDDNKNNIPDFIEDNSSGSLKKQIEEASNRIKNTVRNIFFVVILIIVMGMVYYYLAK